MVKAFKHRWSWRGGCESKIPGYVQCILLRSTAPRRYRSWCRPYGHADLAGEDSIREIIPFPMNKTAQDVMMGAPSEVDPRQLKDVHIKLDIEEKKTEE